PMTKSRLRPEHARDCREALALALILSRQWGRGLFVWTGRGRRPYYIVRDREYVTDQPKGDYHNCYRVSPAGEASPYPGFPAYAQLHGRKGDRIRAESRLKGTDAWSTRSDIAFLLHERAAAEARARELAEQNPTFEYRVCPE